MQFCWSPIKMESLQHGASFEAQLSQTLPSFFQPRPVFIYYFNSSLSQFQSLSQTLTQELFLNNCLIDMKTGPSTQLTETQEAGHTELEPRAQGSNKNASQAQESPGEKIKNQKKIIKKRKNNEGDSESESYAPQPESQKKMASSNLCQSKNIPKNYGKAIMIFIQKHKSFVQRVISHLRLNYRDFMRSVHHVKSKLKTISQLKALWLQEETPFAKAYRIISMEYLRKHCLPYIFNSRVGNYQKHIKYRYKIIESVSDPHNFTLMKEF